MLLQVAKVVKRFEADEKVEAERELQQKLAPLQQRKVSLPIVF